MRLLIKQRVFSWTDSYDIYDEQGNAKYFVKAEFLSIGHKLHIYDGNKNEIGVIREKVFKLLPEFEIEIGGVVRGKVKKQFTFFKPKYEIDFNGWSVQGDVFGWNYDVCEGNCPIAHINKELFHWGDTYVIDVIKSEDELMGMMLVIAIDAANCTQND